MIIKEIINCCLFKPFLAHFYYDQAYAKGLKPRGTINPCGFRTVSNLEEELTKRQRKLAAMLGNVCFDLQQAV
jgi:hypothetical protein